MVFSTILFLFRFLPITLALYYLAPAKLKNTVLFLCSLVFYCWGEVRFFPIMIALILLNYLCGLGLERFDGSKSARKCFLLAGLVGSLGMLFYFKYANFVLSSANALLGTSFSPIQGISTLPLGISFYTFQTLSYTIDVYRRDVKTEHNIIDFGAYVVMFPQLIAGPIVKYRDVAAQLHVTHGRYTLKLGLELGMPHLNPPAAAAICARPEADFILGSVHNLSPERGGTDLFFLDFSTVQACYDALDDYFASLALLAATDFYDVLAHLIYPLRYMQAPVTLNRYQDAIRAILRTAVEKGRGMEVNTCRGRTLEEWRPILALYRDCGGELVTVGSDAHTPADVGKGVRAACALLRECGFRRVCTYEKHQPVFHTLG